ncbi:prostatic spermine-binding protein-like [Rhodamnia argentea]|uniref:Prostatic spermine-binding protein-like n=1 Tax=Rhodamnia argentea TaxID=178133 RepID=A0A8B8NRR5_9MYRT|nr:prostatic spermine-binding protein-like [Rhodamnia argentea]
MKFVLVPILASVVIFVALLLLTSPATLKHGRTDLVDLSSSPLFMFLALNFIVLAILLGSPNPTDHEVGRRFSFSFNEEVRVDDIDADENEVYVDEGKDEDSDHSNDEVTSDGYEEDDDDSGSDGEIGWCNDEDGDEAPEKDEDGDNNLEKRSEDFIARVIKGWWEERVRED